MLWKVLLVKLTRTLVWVKIPKVMPQKTLLSIFSLGKGRESLCLQTLHKKLSKSALSALPLVIHRTSCIALSCCEDLFQGFLSGLYPKNYRKQSLLWETCTGHHWLIALWITIGST